MTKILMLGGTCAIGKSILSVLGNNSKYDITITSRKERKKDYINVHYICGNANDFEFLNTFSNDSYDVLIDFMNYRNEVLEKNFIKLIGIAKQYIFLSSARVYDNSQSIINENCTLLLNTTNDVAFKTSGTYAVKKAYQEEYVRKHGGSKVTIIRPYKTYSAERLQLGEYEINQWLRRLINGKPIVINKEILNKYTSLTDGIDVAKGIIGLIGNENSYGETFQIVSDKYMTWNEILVVYTRVLTKYSIKPVIYLAKNTEVIDKFFESGYQMPYDIMYDRKFCSNKISNIMSISYQDTKKGLEKALSSYLENNILEDFGDTSYDEVVDQFIKNNQLIIWEENLYA